MHSFLKENPKSGVTALSWKLPAALPHPSLCARGGFPGIPQSAFPRRCWSSATGWLGEAGRSLGSGKKPREERENGKISREPAYGGILFTWMLLRHTQIARRLIRNKHPPHLADTNKATDHRKLRLLSLRNDHQTWKAEASMRIQPGCRSTTSIIRCVCSA